eukprot:1161423-Pelagomonas_calceolata.AAC.11
MEGDTSVRSAYAESTSGTAACWSAWEAPPQPSPSSAAPSSAPDHADSEQLSPPPPLPAPAKAALLLTCAWVLAAPLPVVHALWRFRSCKNVRALQMSVAMRPTCTVPTAQHSTAHLSSAQREGFQLCIFHVHISDGRQESSLAKCQTGCPSTACTN